MLNKKYLKIAQLMIAVGIIWSIFSHTDKSKIIALIYQIPPLYLYLSALLLISQLIISAYRWLLIIRLSGFNIPVIECIGSVASSTLINTTLPVAIAGDIVRMWVATRNGLTSKIAICTVLSDRILSMVVLGLLVVLVILPYMLFTNSSLKTLDINTAALAYALLLLGVFVIILCIQPLLSKFKIRPMLILSTLINISSMNRNILKASSKTLNLLIAIILGHALLIISIMVLAYGMHISLPFWKFLIGALIALLFSTTPITPGGWGVREGAMILALGQFQVSPEAAFGISVLFGIGITVASLPGSILWILYKHTTNKSSKLNFQDSTTDFLP